MKLLEFDSVSLAVDEFGDKCSPPVLLIAGATQSMDWWTPDFCQLLAAEGLYVIRYDQRDTGVSTTSPPGRPDYMGIDLANDPLRILDALGIGAAHLVGLSMGGGIAQYLGATEPLRVRTLTLIESSPIGGDSGELPLPDLSLGAAENELPVNHFLVAGDTEADPSTLTMPTLVIHSDTDPLFALPHGEALACMIPHATLLRVHGMGHEAPPPRVWKIVIPALADHVLRCHATATSGVAGSDA